MLDATEMRTLSIGFTLSSLLQISTIYEGIS